MALEFNQNSTLSNSANSAEWSRKTWRLFPRAQKVCYQADQPLDMVVAWLEKAQPLVSDSEVSKLNAKLNSSPVGGDPFGEAWRNRPFLLQMGDCVESFSNVNWRYYKEKVSFLQNTAEVIEKALGRPVVCVGRLGGQFAKPRSQMHCVLPDPIGESKPKEGILQPDPEVFNFLGEMINSPIGEKRLREPDPMRMWQAYQHAFSISEYLSQFHERTGKEIFSSHEALHLDFESCFVQGNTALSGHFLWIGDRTKQSQGAHIEFVSGLRNPLGIKVGPETDFEDLHHCLMKIVSRASTLGINRNVYVIPRFGAKNIEKKLPTLFQVIASINASTIPSVSSSHDADINQVQPQHIKCLVDPMHGNSITSSEGIKIRSVDDIKFELEKFVELSFAHEVPIEGIHLEATHENVNECIGGALEYGKGDLRSGYQSLLDPRLNYSQTLEVVLHYAQKLNENLAVLRN